MIFLKIQKLPEQWHSMKGVFKIKIQVSKLHLIDLVVNRKIPINLVQMIFKHRVNHKIQINQNQ